MRRNQLGLDGVGMDAVIDFGQVTANIPAQLLALSFFQALELFDEV